MTIVFEMLIALVLSHIIVMGLDISTCISFKVCFIHRIYVEKVVATIYSTSVVDREIEPFSY